MQVQLERTPRRNHAGPAQLRREKLARIVRHFGPRDRRPLHPDRREAASQGRSHRPSRRRHVHADAVETTCTPRSTRSRTSSTAGASVKGKNPRSRRPRVHHHGPEARRPEVSCTCRRARRALLRARHRACVRGRRLSRVRLIIVSGLSGSGKSVALHMLEDLDFYCVDNIPAGLLPGFIAYTVRTSDPTYRQHGGRRRRAQPPRGPGRGAAAGRRAARAASPAKSCSCAPTRKRC